MSNQQKERIYEFYAQPGSTSNVIAVFGETKEECYARNWTWEGYLPCGTEPDAPVSYDRINPVFLREQLTEEEARKRHPRLIELVDASCEPECGLHWNSQSHL